MKDFLSKCDQIRGFLRICSHLLKKSLMENFILYSDSQTLCVKFLCVVSLIASSRKLVLDTILPDIKHILKSFKSSFLGQLLLTI